MWKAFALLSFSAIVVDVAYHLLDWGELLRKWIDAPKLPRGALRNGIAVPSRNS